jgi:hypothetical protein
MFALLTVGVLIGSVSLRADEVKPDKKTPPKTAQAWTLDQAMLQLRLNPDDVYLQYVALQLARNEGEKKAEEVANLITSIWERPDGSRRRLGGPDRRVDLFDLFTGALAVQESLQLDTMRGRRPGEPADSANAAESTVKVTELSGPKVESHPWGKMLAVQQIAGKKPEIGQLDLCVPEDQYYIAFRSLTKLLEGVDAGDVWGSHLFNQAAKCAKTQRTADRLKTQLAMQTDPLTRPFYDLVVEEVALTGSDLFFREGADVTMLFRIKQPEVFRLRMDGFLEAAAKSRPDAVRSTGKIGAVEYVSVATPDRAVHAFSAYPKPDLHVRSNSKPALQRVLAAIAGDKKVTRLGDSTEFKYIRTLMPRGSKQEDGLIYLSDPFIRRLVGPELKLTERRRMLCYNHLRIIGHAAMLYRTQYGQPAKSLDELADSGCAPAPFATDTTGKIRREALACACGGKYSLAADGLTGVCSHHGYAHELTPCCEIPLEKVTAAEAKEYKQFVEQYSQYWRRFFDPIAVRVQLTPGQYRAETIILPLIDNSIYTGMAMALGGEPEPLDALPVPKGNIFSIVARVNKEELLKKGTPTRGMLRDVQQLGLPQKPGAVSLEDFLTNGLGNQIGMHTYDSSPMFDFNLTGFLGEMMGSFRGMGGGMMNSEMLPISFLIASLNSPVYLAVPVKDEKIVDKFLDDLDDALAVLARQGERGGWFGLDYDFYRIQNSTPHAPREVSEEGNRTPHAPREGSKDRTRCYSVQFGPIKWRVFFARIDKALYIASKRFILDDLASVSPLPLGEGPGVRAEKHSSPLTVGEGPGVRAANNGPTAHAMIRIRPEHWKEILPTFQLGWAESSREACLNNLGPLSSVARAVAATSNGQAKPAEVVREADVLHGAHSFCPDGGKYEVSADGREVRCSLHGTAMQPRQLLAPSPGSPMGQVMKDFHGLTAELTFLEDGLHAVVTIKRK